MSSTTQDHDAGFAAGLSQELGASARRGLIRAADRPVVTTAVIGLVFTVAQILWFAHARDLGSFDVDEAGGLATALRFHRLVGADPRPLLGGFFGTRNGPLVPMLAVPFLVVGPRSIVTAMIVQPVLVVAASCGAAGVLASMGHRRAAVLGGVAAMGLSISVVSSRSFQYSTGVAAFMALAMWALSASDGGRKRAQMVAFGVAVGAMLLSRTMAVSFLPAVALAAVIVVRRNRDGWRNLALSAAVTILVAGPWWWIQWGPITDYLYENAYGDRAHYWGSVPLSARWDDHVRYYGSDFKFASVLVPSVAALVVVSLAVVRPGAGAWKAWADRSRPLIAAWAVVVIGSAALLSTSNRGFWFAHPLDVMFVVGVIGMLAQVPLGGRHLLRLGRDALAVAWLAVVAITFAVSLDPAGPADPRSDRPSSAETFIASLDRLQIGNVDADERTGSRDLAARKAAASDWYDANAALAAVMEDLDERRGPLLETVTGEIHLFNANTIILAQETSTDLGVALEVVNTLEPPDDELVEHTSVFEDGLQRVLVIIDGRSLPFPDGRDIGRFTRIARDEGWREHSRIPLPDGGAVRVYTHPRGAPRR